MENLSPPPDPLASITEEQWVVLWLKLRLHTRRRFGGICDKFGWESDSIATQAISDTMSGKRSWPPRDRTTGQLRYDVSLFTFLCQVVRSLISHRYAEGKKSFGSELPGPERDSKLSTNPPFELLLYEASFRYPQLVRPDSTEDDIYYRLLTDEMCALVKDDEEVLNILKLWRVDPTLRPREIAGRLGMTMPQMRAAQKRLRRVVKKHREG